jgi:hypothetical protein
MPVAGKIAKKWDNQVGEVIVLAGSGKHVTVLYIKFEKQ